MSEHVNNLWVAPVIGGLITLIGLVAPAYTFYISIEEEVEYLYVWMWGLLITNKVHLSPASFYTFLASSIICSTLVFLGAVMLFSVANKIRTGKKRLRDIKNKFYLISIQLIISTLVWICIVSSFWYGNSPVGVFLIFTGALITIFGVYVAKFTISYY